MNNSLITKVLLGSLALVGCLLAQETIASSPLSGSCPEFGYGYFNDKAIPELMEYWGSDNPGLRNISALETARRVWRSDSPVETLKSLIPDLQAALESDQPNRRRAVADFVYGLWRAGGKYKGLKVRLSDEDKLAGIQAMRKELGVLLPIIVHNLKSDPHLWARTGAVDMARRIIPPYNQEADGLYEDFAKQVRPLLLIRSKDDDKFMKQAAAEALYAIGIGGLDSKEIVDCMTGVIETQVAQSVEEAIKVLGQLDGEALASISEILIETLGSDVVGTAAGLVATKLLLKIKPPGTAAAVIDHVTRDRHGHGVRAMELFPLIQEFSDEDFRSALPELRRLATMEEVRGRYEMAQALGTIQKLEKSPKLKSAEVINLDNARNLVARPPHQWVLEIFDRLGEPRPKVGREFSGDNPAKSAKVSPPPWIPRNVDERVPLPKTDALYGSRAMDLLPTEKGTTLPLDLRAFSDEAPETGCGLLNIQLPNPEVDLRRPLGPTGILGTFSNRRIMVLGTQPGSPSHGKVYPGDWILGVNDRFFTKEPRIGMGYAIEESEGRADGKMTLKILRQSHTLEVNLHLESLGRHVDTWPYGCDKSARVLGNLCEFIVEHDANWVIPGALVLLASGEDKYLPKIRREVYQLAKTGPTESNWFTSYQLITLCEYYQRVGDENILPAIQNFAKHLTSGQTYFGGYLHNKSYFNEFNDASLVGYGEMNMAGAPVLVSLILANECGVEMNNTAFRKSLDYFKIFSGRGCVPYGAHPPYIDSPETGGKTATIGVAFDLLGDPQIAKPFVSMTGSAYEHMWTGYHGGSYWNATWRPLSVARDSAESFKTLARHNLWHYNLARHWHGGMTAPVRTSADFTMNHNPTEVMAFGMIYALPRKAIRLTGAPRSVFSKMSSLGMTEILKVYHSRNEEALKQSVAELKKGSISEETKIVLDELLAVATRRSNIESLEQQELKEALEAKDYFKADQMIFAMTQSGMVMANPLTLSLKDVGPDEINKGQRYFEALRKLRSGPVAFEASETETLQALSASDGFYADLAKKTMAKYQIPAKGKWELPQRQEVEKMEEENIGWLFYLISPSLDEVRKIRMRSWVTEVGEPHPVDDFKTHPDLKSWYTPDYDDAHWPVEVGPYLIQEKLGSEREAHVVQRYNFEVKQAGEIDELYLKLRLGPRDFRGTFYLNGEAVVEFLESPCGNGRSRGHRNLGQKTTYLKLPHSVKNLLKEGHNVLAIRADLPPISNWSHGWMRMVDVGLGATRKGGGRFNYDPMVKGE